MAPAGRASAPEAVDGAVTSSATEQARAHRVAVLLHQGMSTFETGIVSDVFGLWRPETGDRSAYELLLCAPDDVVHGIGGVTLRSAHGLDELARADTVVVAGVTDVHADPPAAVLEALRRAAERGARIASICSGAFALAAAGLLDGRRATTHWRYAALLARRHPAVRVDPDVLFVDEGRVLTSAGSAAGIDLCLHLVRTDHGSRAANAVARRMVAPPHRDGGQAQFVEAPVPPEHDHGGVARAMAHAVAHLADPLTVASMAREAGLTPRTFARRFRDAVGTTPIRWLAAQRVRATLPALEVGDAGIEVVADSVGLDAVTYRRHFRVEMATTPSAYRRTFATAGPGGRDT